jgi:hypothetical protein
MSLCPYLNSYLLANYIHIKHSAGRCCNCSCTLFCLSNCWQTESQFDITFIFLPRTIIYINIPCSLTGWHILLCTQRAYTQNTAYPYCWPLLCVNLGILMSAVPNYHNYICTCVFSTDLHHKEHYLSIPGRGHAERAYHFCGSYFWPEYVTIQYFMWIYKLYEKQELFGVRVSLSVWVIFKTYSQ